MSSPSILDLGFFITETDDSPKHVGGLWILRKPKRAGANYVSRLAEELRGFDAPSPPFNQVVEFTARGGPRWKEYANFDITRHVIYHRPASQLSRRALYAMVADLHGTRLERSRPMWEYHLIDSLDGGRFAIYSKVHHAYADGITLSRWSEHSLDARPTAKSLRPIWIRKGREKPVAPGARTEARSPMLFDGVLTASKALAGMAKLATQLMLEQAHLTKNAVALPFKAAPDTPLTGPVCAGRQFASARVLMERVNRIRDMTRCSLNHVALTCIDGALHRYLEEQGVELDQPITILMPVSLRTEEDGLGGNRIGIVLVELAGPTKDPYQRLREIGFTLRSVRNQVDGVAPAAVVGSTLVLTSFAQLTETLGLTARLPPLAHTLVSNVPGPGRRLYLKGAEVEEMYPISALAPGNRLNITLYSYADNLHFGLIASQQLEDLEGLGTYIEQAFVDLEAAVFKPRQRSAGH